MTTDASARVSVILPAYAHCPHLADVVAAIYSGSCAPFEVIVSHSGPDDPTGDLTARFADLTVLHESGRLFAGAARNRGAAVARGDILAFCDADTLPNPDWLVEVTRAIDTEARLFVVGAVGMSRRGGYWGMSNWLLEFSEQAPWRPAGDQSGGASCNFAVTAADFRAVGGFREDLRGGEDTTLFSSLRNAGLTQRFCPRAVVGHFNNSGFAAFARHQSGLGAGFAEVRARQDMPGSFLVRRPPLAILLWAPKAFVVLRRTAASGLRPFAFALFMTPGVVIGSFLWSLSCARHASAIARRVKA